jgi:two-component sensor histidine kinase
MSGTWFAFSSRLSPASSTSRIAVRGPSLRLKAASAQAIGLALHELATNAGKYGALSTNEGRVDIWWQADANQFTMSWTENEGPPVVAPTRLGFGSTVIDTMAKHSLGGEVALYYARSGLMWQLTCPATNAVEPQEPAADGVHVGDGGCSAGWLRRHAVEGRLQASQALRAGRKGRNASLP